MSYHSFLPICSLGFKLVINSFVTLGDLDASAIPKLYELKNDVGTITGTSFSPLLQ